MRYLNLRGFTGEAGGDVSTHANRQIRWVWMKCFGCFGVGRSVGLRDWGDRSFGRGMSGGGWGELLRNREIFDTAEEFYGILRGELYVPEG
jgi:hypothetical protein